MSLITINPNDSNYLDCNLDAVVLNPNGAIKYYNHYHTALYEDEKFDYFIPYQVKVINKYAGIHRGPARRYPTLAMIVVKDTYTITEERNGWGRLKEYPTGWIMLNATEPMTGPGQNPDYDVADQEVATIPFGEEIHITKLTIDRLWCWVPAVESWVKAEDVSYNQSGKLYNALDLKVIDLSKIDFSALGDSPTLADVGIYPEAKRLRFHNASNYSYTGEYTKAAFSALHELNFVYPETVYNYTCIYYKDNKSDDNELGRSAFSCSISDWNPDWDTFISTSWQADEKSYGYLDRDKTLTIYSDTTTSSSSETYSYKAGTKLFGTKITLGDLNWWPILKENGEEWRGYVLTQPTVEYTSTPVNPTLYRDTVLTLSWDYFGFNRNLYKPAGKSDGIYLWNPRSWDINNIMFSFEELVSCGSQYVIYPDFDPNLYKITINSNYMGASKQVPYRLNGELFYKTVYLMSPGIKAVRLLDSASDWGLSDIGVSSEIADMLSIYQSTGFGSEIGSASGSKTQYVTLVEENILLGKHSGYFAIKCNENSLEQGYRLAYDNFNLGRNYLLEGNISGQREYSPVIFRVNKNNVTQEPGQYYYVKQVKEDSNKFESYPIYYNTNLKDGVIKGGYYKPNLPFTTWDLAQGTYNYLYSYKNSMMTHYWVPVPKGLRYYWNGVLKRIPENGLYDLLTSDFKCAPRATDGDIDGFTPTIDGRTDIWLRETPVDFSKDSYNYFNGWNYTSTDCDYIVKTKATTPTYKQPDTYATSVRSLASGLVLPVSKSTSDSANNIVGEWYFGGDQWFESNKCEIYAGTFDKTKLTKIQQQICLINNATGTLNFYTHLDPSTLTTSTESSSYSYGSAPAVLTTYYSYTNDVGTFYFDGAYWIPKDYTDKNVTEVNKNYAIARSTIYYSVPIADNEYKIGTYSYGDRITVPYVSTNNTDWAYTGLGWIQLTNNVSEVV